MRGWDGVLGTEPLSDHTGLCWPRSQPCIKGVPGLQAAGLHRATAKSPATPFKLCTVLRPPFSSSAPFSGPPAVWTQVRLVCLQVHSLGLAGLFLSLHQMTMPAVPGLRPKLFLVVFCRGPTLLVTAAACNYQRMACTFSLAVPFSYAYTSLWIWSKEV